MCVFKIPGPLSSIVTINLSSDFFIWLICTFMSGRIFASSHASRELSIPSLIVVSKAFLGLSNPSKCLFFVKNSLTEISLCFFARSLAVIFWSLFRLFFCFFRGCHLFLFYNFFFLFHDPFAITAKLRSFVICVAYGV